MKPVDRFIVMVWTAVLVFGLAGCGGGGGGGTGSTAPTVDLGGTGFATTPGQAPGSIVQPTTNTAGQINGDVTANIVGTDVCGQCHSKFPFSNHFAAGDPYDGNGASTTYFDPAAGGSIYANYVNSVHYTPHGSGSIDYVTCEGCHGPGSQHYGVGPIAFYAPGVTQCEACHNGTGPSISAVAIISHSAFNATAHANADNSPDQFFFQGATGTSQANYFGGGAEYQDVNGAVPVNKNQAIEECSVCHNPEAQPAHIAKGDVQNPPQVACSACHDPHKPADRVRNYIGGAPVDPSVVPNFKPYRVNNNAFGTQFGAINSTGGTWIRPRLHYAYQVGGDAANTYSGYANQTTTGDWLRLSPERLCAACHTKGQYKYGRRAGSTLLTETHQTDVFTQYKHSLHAAFNDKAWKDFSLLSEGGDRRPQYPFDMGGVPGQNGSTVPFDGRINGGANDFVCFQCHNGIGTIDYLNGVQGGKALGDSNKTHVIWGDTTATCITCHDPHKNGAATSQNVRTPRYLSFNAEFRPDNSPTGTGNARGGVGKFLDLTEIPGDIGNGIICMFCHQGRESGWTAWNKVRRTRVGLGDSTQASSDFWYAQPNSPITPAGFSFVNDHYLAAGALLYGRNSTEFIGQFYSDGIPQHHQKGCTGCHMDNPDAASTAGGHTFRPVITTCQQCHAGAATFHDIRANGDWNGNGAIQTVFDELGTLQVIPIAALGGPGHGAPIYGTGVGGTGLFGLLNEALWDAGIEYDPSLYPYFFKPDLAHVAANGFKAFTPNTLAAAQNLNQLFFTGGPGQQAVYVHNPFYGAQILIDSLGVLGHAAGAGGVPFERPVTAGGGTTHAGRDYRTLVP